MFVYFFFFFKQKTAYEMRISDWSSDVCSSDLMQARRSVLPRPGELLVETFPHEGVHYMVCYPFEGWNAHQSLGMLVTKRMERAGLQPLGFVASDYAIAIWSLREVTKDRKSTRLTSSH